MYFMPNISSLSFKATAAFVHYKDTDVLVLLGGSWVILIKGDYIFYNLFMK